MASRMVLLAIAAVCLLSTVSANGEYRNSRGLNYNIIVSTGSLSTVYFQAITPTDHRSR